MIGRSVRGVEDADKMEVLADLAHHISVFPHVGCVITNTVGLRFMTGELSYLMWVVKESFLAEKRFPTELGSRRFQQGRYGILEKGFNPSHFDPGRVYH